MKTDLRRHSQSGVKCLTALHNNTRGQTLIEYVLIIVVIALMVIAAMKLFKESISSTYSSAASSISNP